MKIATENSWKMKMLLKICRFDFIKTKAYVKKRANQNI